MAAAINISRRSRASAHGRVRWSSSIQNFHIKICIHNYPRPQYKKSDRADHPRHVYVCSSVCVHDTRCLVCSISMRRVCRFSKFQNFTSLKPTFRIYVPSWLPTPVRKSRYQTHCNFLSNFETRDFCRVLRNAPSNGRRGRLIAMTVSAIFNQGSETTFLTLG